MDAPQSPRRSSISQSLPPSSLAQKKDVSAGTLLFFRRKVDIPKTSSQERVIDGKQLIYADLGRAAFAHLDTSLGTKSLMDRSVSHIKDQKDLEEFLIKNGYTESLIPKGNSFVKKSWWRRLFGLSNSQKSDLVTQMKKMRMIKYIQRDEYKPMEQDARKDDIDPLLKNFKEANEKVRKFSESLSKLARFVGGRAKEYQYADAKIELREAIKALEARMMKAGFDPDMIGEGMHRLFQATKSKSGYFKNEQILILQKGILEENIKANALHDSLYGNQKIKVYEDFTDRFREEGLGKIFKINGNARKTFQQDLVNFLRVNNYPKELIPEAEKVKSTEKMAILQAKIDMYSDLASIGKGDIAEKYMEDPDLLLGQRDKIREILPQLNKEIYALVDQEIRISKEGRFKVKTRLKSIQAKKASLEDTRAFYARELGKVEETLAKQWMAKCAKDDATIVHQLANVIDADKGISYRSIQGIMEKSAKTVLVQGSLENPARDEISISDLTVLVNKRKVFIEKFKPYFDEDALTKITKIQELNAIGRSKGISDKDISQDNYGQFQTEYTGFKKSIAQCRKDISSFENNGVLSRDEAQWHREVLTQREKQYRQTMRASEQPEETGQSAVSGLPEPQGQPAAVGQFSISVDTLDDFLKDSIILDENEVYIRKQLSTAVDAKDVTFQDLHDAMGYLQKYGILVNENEGEWSLEDKKDIISVDELIAATKLLKYMDPVDKENIMLALKKIVDNSDGLISYRDIEGMLINLKIQGIEIEEDLVIENEISLQDLTDKVLELKVFRQSLAEGDSILSKLEESITNAGGIGQLYHNAKKREQIFNTHTDIINIKVEDWRTEISRLQRAGVLSQAGVPIEQSKVNEIEAKLVAPMQGFYGLRECSMTSYAFKGVDQSLADAVKGSSIGGYEFVYDPHGGGNCGPLAVATALFMERKKEMSAFVDKFVNLSTSHPQLVEDIEKFVALIALDSMEEFIKELGNEATVASVNKVMRALISNSVEKMRNTLGDNSVDSFLGQLAVEGTDIAYDAINIFLNSVDSDIARVSIGVGQIPDAAGKIALINYGEHFVVATPERVV